MTKTIVPENPLKKRPRTVVTRLGRGQKASPQECPAIVYGMSSGIKEAQKGKGEGKRRGEELN